MSYRSPHTVGRLVQVVEEGCWKGMIGRLISTHGGSGFADVLRPCNGYGDHMVKFDGLPWPFDTHAVSFSEQDLELVPLLVNP